MEQIFLEALCPYMVGPDSGAKGWLHGHYVNPNVLCCVSLKLGAIHHIFDYIINI